MMRAAVIEIKGLSFHYPDGKQALCDVDLSLKAGEKVALVGTNGAGKSTLLLQLNGILQGSGAVSVGGLPIEKQNLGRIRAMVGLVFQNPDDQLFSPTVYDDLAYGLIYQGLRREEINLLVSTTLETMGMRDSMDRNPYHLSNGEKKRVAIATVLAMHPEVLVLDEPTTGLDPRSRRELISLLADLPQTMLIATHDLDMAARLTWRTVIMNQGRIVADGLTEAILADNTLLDQFGLI
jgi:cobalt/nickel transport system ATP-binding protein